MTATLHYIFDPLCGWCYAAAPLVHAAAQLPGLQIVLHGGGMMTDTSRRQITSDWRNYVLPHDDRIAQMTGQEFGTAYRDGLLNAVGVWLDSAPPTTAILAAEQLAGKGLPMLGLLQKAHYVRGLHISELPVLTNLAGELGLEGTAFSAAYGQLQGFTTQQHIDQSRRMLQASGAQGFPTLLVQRTPDEALQRIDVSEWLGQAPAFADALNAYLQA
ncbi:MAG: DsbA family protein [Comamonas sp.]